MAFPTVAGVGRGGSANLAVDNIDIVFDAVPDSGDLLVILLGVDGLLTATFPDGYTAFPGMPEVSSTFTLNMVYRVCDGSEAASINVTFSGSDQATYQAYRITGHAGTAPTGCTPAAAATDSPDPPLCDPGSSAERLWLAVFGLNNSVITVSSYPSNYTNGITDASSGARVGSARRELEASSEDPGVFTLSASQSWVSYTVGIAATGGGGGGEVFLENRHGIEQGIKPQTAAGIGGVLIE